MPANVMRGHPHYDWQTTKELHVYDGSAWRTCTQAWVYDGTTWQLFFSPGDWLATPVLNADQTNTEPYTFTRLYWTGADPSTEIELWASTGFSGGFSLYTTLGTGATEWFPTQSESDTYPRWRVRQKWTQGLVTQYSSFSNIVIRLQ